MKRKAFNKDIFRSILNSKSRFFAIFAIVALGAGFFSGLCAISYDMRLTGDSYYDDSHMMDIRLVSGFGFTDEDVRAVEATDGVENVMAGYSVDAISNFSGDDVVVRIHSLPTDMSDDNGAWLNRPTLTEGRLPERSGECVMSATLTGLGDIKIGDIVTLDNDDGSLDDFVSCTEFEVVGFADSAYYIALTYGTSSIGNGTLERFMYISEENFCSEVYTEVFVTAEDADALNCFSDEYDSKIEKTKTDLTKLSDERSPLRLEQIKKDAQKELDDAREEYNEAKEKAEVSLSDALAVLENAEEEIKNSESQLNDAQRQINDGRAQISEKLTQYNDGVAQYNAALEQYNTLSTQYNDAKAALDVGYAEYEAQLAAGADPAMLAAMKAQLDAKRAQLEAQKPVIDAMKTALDSTKTQLDSSKLQLDAAAASLDELQRQIDSGRRALDTAKEELADGWTEYNDAKQQAENELSDALDEINDAQEEIDSIELQEWYVLGRDTNIGFVSFSDDTDRMESLATVFPVLFFLVAALVALTTMTRMVDEERMVIGTYKALGYSNARIMSKYLGYAFAASVTGSLAGIAVLMKVIPMVVWAAYGILYNAPPIQMPYNIVLVLGGVFSATACTMLSTYFACASALKEQPSALLRPRAPKSGKRIFLERIGFLWNRLKFTQKVTCRNLFRYKKRFYMTLIGIAGCTGLLLTGFGVKDSVSDIVNRQFNVIYKYDTMIGLAEEELSKDAKRLLDDGGNFEGWLPVSQKAAEIKGGGEVVSGYVFIPSESDGLTDFIELKDMDSDEPIAFGADSVVLTQKASDIMGASVGDTVSVEVESGRYCDFTVTGVTENYVYHYLYISPEMWDSVTGLETEYTMITAKCAVDGAARETLSDKLMDCESIGTVQFTDSLSAQFDDMIVSINYVVLVLIICAGALAFVVLYNLTNINVTERKRELATIKVLGFYDNEVSAYIYRETAILTLLGCGLGLGLGVIMHRFVAKTVEVNAVMFGRDISPQSFVWAALLTIVFSVIVNLVMHKKFKNIDMVESLKSAE